VTAIGKTGPGAVQRWQSRCPTGIGLLVLCILLSIVPTLSARAHSQGAVRTAPEDGISIPNISHGQMIVMADNRAAILELAARQAPTDRVMRRLQGYINLQFSACLWGLVPGSVADEDSPFNECAHAYLAATRALLLHLQDMPGDRAAVRALVEKIELEMLTNEASLVMCLYSEQSFNTAQVIYPDLSSVPYHVLSLMVFGGLALTIVGCASMAVRWKPDSRGD
jgi:hypothetical protein